MHFHENGSAAALAPIADTPHHLKVVQSFTLKPARPRPAAAVGKVPTPLLIISPFDEDFLSLLDILKPSDWAIHWSSKYADAMNILRKYAIPVVLCERELLDGSWRSLAAEVQLLPAPPRIVITSVLPDEDLWVEALHAGVQLLRKPFEAAEVIRVVTNARILWNCMRAERERNAIRKKSA